MPRESTACFTGHRPEKLPWGYNEADMRCFVLKAELSKMILQAYGCGYTHFIAGGALMGVVSALLKYFGADWFATEWNGTTGAEVLSLAMYILLIAYFVRDSLRDSARKNNGS